MFLDRVQLRLVAGKGGDGLASFRREKFLPKGGPHGGNGGHGGSITFKASPHPFSLESFRNSHLICAKNGAQGGTNLCTGKNGASIELPIPLGTLIKDAKTGNILFDCTSLDQSYTACKGGKGGKGNTHFKSPTNRTPQQFTLGSLGEEKEVILELKLIADIGLVGLPNAGKSTLISSITPLSAKVGAYPFTTLKPNLGLLTFSEEDRCFIADIPGIIAGAHKNKGLGLDFLRHIERTKILLFVLDPFSPTFLEDFATLQNELKAYREDLLEKPSLLVINKSDIPGSDQLIEEFQKTYPNEKPLILSAKEETGLNVLKTKLHSLFLEEKQTSEKNLLEEIETLCLS